jgi:hypothetical protein
MADMQQNSQVQQRSDEREPQHWKTNPSRVEANYGCARTGSERERAYPNCQAKTVDRNDRSTDALQKCKEETRPSNYATFVCSIFE